MCVRQYVATSENGIYMWDFHVGGPSTSTVHAGPPCTVEVDEYSSLTLDGAYQLAEQEIVRDDREGQPLYVWTAAGGPGDRSPSKCNGGGKKRTSSCPQIFYRKDLYVPFVSLVINLDNGNVKSMIFDNICTTCGSGFCVESRSALNEDLLPRGGLRAGTCASYISEMKTGEGTEDKFKIFVTWAGTDAKGRHCKTHSFRFSQFAGATLNDMWSWTKESYNTAVE